MAKQKAEKTNTYFFTISLPDEGREVDFEIEASTESEAWEILHLEVEKKYEGRRWFYAGRFVKKRLRINKMKEWYKSKTIWLNLISLLIEIAQYLLDMNVIPTGTLLIVVNVLNIIVRFITNSGIGNEDTDRTEF